MNNYHYPFFTTEGGSSGGSKTQELISMSKSTDSMIDKMNETKNEYYSERNPALCKCPDCKWFKGFEDTPYLYGKCHINPPILVSLDRDFDFPAVSINDYCSHLELK